MNRILIIVSFLFLVNGVYAQLVDVQADYNGIGDCVFTANNNAKTPVFLHIDFADLENTSFNETLPYVKKLDPGFNNLFTLERYPDSDVPRFNYQLKSYRSNPASIVDLDFPYLIPFQPGAKVQGKEVENIKGFWGETEPESWIATGFVAKSGDAVFASRQGEIVEIVGANRTGESQSWYNTWTYSITVLHPDGTLICYRNVLDKDKNLKLNQKIYAGQPLGEIAPGTNELVILIYQNSLSSDDLRFIIPEFSISENETELLNPAKDYNVVHPVSVRGLEMTKKEKKKVLGKNK